MATITEHLDLVRRLPPPSERRIIRTRLDLTQRQMGESIGVTSQAIAAWEAGQTPSDRNLASYVDLLEHLRSLAIEGGDQDRNEIGS